MSHSRIFQLRTERMDIKNGDERVTADYFVDNNCFIGPIADYVSDDCNPREDFEDLTEFFQNVLGEGYETHFTHHYDENDTAIPEAYITFRPGFKKAYFKEQYAAFLKLVEKTSLENFMDRFYIGSLEEAIRDKFNFYVAEGDDVYLCPIDTFLRGLPDDEEITYWLWGTVDYHY